MASLVIKNLPEELHRRLKDSAVQNRRSMAMQAVVLMEKGLGAGAGWELPPPIKLSFPLTEEFLNRAKREGRA